MCVVQYTYGNCAFPKCSRVELVDEKTIACRKYVHGDCFKFRLASKFRGEGHWRIETRLKHYCAEHCLEENAPPEPFTVYDKAVKVKIYKLIDSIRRTNTTPALRLHIAADLESWWDRMKGVDRVMTTESTAGSSTAAPSHATESTSAYASNVAASEVAATEAVEPETTFAMRIDPRSYYHDPIYEPY